MFRSGFATQLSLLLSLLLCVSLSLSFISPSFAKKCINETSQFVKMDEVRVTFVETERSENVKLADTNAKRAMGFQHICPEVIAQNMILFTFPTLLRPAFHMRNVHAPLDIAFIDRNRRVVNIMVMRPYVAGSLKRPTYSPDVAVTAALEASEGRLHEMGIKVGSTIDW